MGIFFTQIVDPNVIPVDDYFRVGKNEVGVDALLDAAAQGSVDGLVKNAKNADVVSLLIRLEEEVQVVSSNYPKMPKKVLEAVNLAPSNQKVFQNSVILMR